MNVITWNMQGATAFGESKWNTDVRRLFLAGAEVVCLQECGVPPPSADPVAPPPILPGYAPPGGMGGGAYLWNLGSTSRGLNTAIIWLQTDPGANRNNLALVVSLAVVNPINTIVIPNGLGGRPALGARLRDAHGNQEDLYTLHAFSPGGADAPGLITGIVGVGAPAWFAGGDYNRLPSSWVTIPAGSALAPHTGTVTHPGSGTNLDYAFAQAGTNFQGVVSSGFVVSDHYPVAYII